MRFVLILFLISEIAYAQMMPQWVNPLVREREYLDKDYYIGFVSQSFQKGEKPDQFIEQLKGRTRTALSESIFIKIKSESSAELSSINGESEDRYQKTTLTSSSLEAVGMKTETYIDERKRVVYAFASVEKKALARYYLRLVADELKRIGASLERIGSLKTFAEAYEQYSEELNALNAIKEYQDMLRYLNASSNLTSTKWSGYYNTTLSALDSLRDTRDLALDDAIYYSISQLKTQLGTDSSQLSVRLITYKSTGIPTELSNYINTKLTQVINERLGRINPSISSEELTLGGSYWPGENELQLVININQVRRGEVTNLVAGSSVAVSLDKIEQLGIGYDLSDEALLVKNHQLRPTTSIGGLTANLTTQKGSQSVIFKEGETLNLYANVSRPVYLRVINIWSDNQKFLLADNYLVSGSQVNQSIKLPFAWETACPCGVEHIQLIAQDIPFEPIQTENVDGFVKIKEDLETVLTKQRGFKRKAQYYAESSIILTTIQ